MTFRVSTLLLLLGAKKTYCLNRMKSKCRVLHFELEWPTFWMKTTCLWPGHSMVMRCSLLSHWVSAFLSLATFSCITYSNHLFSIVYLSDHSGGTISRKFSKSHNRLSLPRWLIEKHYGQIVYQFQGDGQAFFLAAAQLSRVGFSHLVQTHFSQNHVNLSQKKRWKSISTLKRDQRRCTNPLIFDFSGDTEFELGGDVHGLPHCQELVEVIELRNVSRQSSKFWQISRDSVDPHRTCDPGSSVENLKLVDDVFVWFMLAHLNPTRTSTSAVFPAPDGPIIAVSSPALNSPLTFCRIFFFSVTFSRLMRTISFM